MKYLFSLFMACVLTALVVTGTTALAGMKVQGESRWAPTAVVNGQIVGVSGTRYENPSVDTSGGLSANDIHRLNEPDGWFEPSLFDPDGIPNSGDEYTS